MKSIPRTCTNCQVEFLADSREVNRGNARFCSISCSTKFNARGRAPEPNVSCENCKKRIYRKAGRLRRSKTGLFFCNSECQNSAASDDKSSYSVGPTPKQGSEAKVCLRCGGAHHSKTSNTCASCYTPFQIEQWLAGNNSVTLSGGVTKNTKTFVKDYLIKTRGDQCEECGWNERSPDGRSIIQMDHINGDCFDNRPENLRLLCPNHHAMTPTYGSLNKGSGRSHRRKAS